LDHTTAGSFIARANPLVFLQGLRRYVRAVLEMPTDLSSEKKLEQFLTDLAPHRDVSASATGRWTTGAESVQLNI